MIFNSPTSGRLNVSQMTKDIRAFVQEDPDAFYSLIIGTDSQAKRLNGKAEIDFVIAVVVHRKGTGARYYWKKIKKDQSLRLRDKIYTETIMSLTMAEKLVPRLRQALSAATYDFEIHIDVGPLGSTRDMIKEVVGMVNGSGYTAKTKPNSWGASSVADRYA